MEGAVVARPWVAVLAALLAVCFGEAARCTVVADLGSEVVRGSSGAVGDCVVPEVSHRSGCDCDGGCDCGHGCGRGRLYVYCGAAFFAVRGLRLPCYLLRPL